MVTNCEVLTIQADSSEPGVLIHAVNPPEFVERDSTELALYMSDTERMPLIGDGHRMLPLAFRKFVGNY